MMIWSQIATNLGILELLEQIEAEVCDQHLHFIKHFLQHSATQADNNKRIMNLVKQK